MHGLQYAEHQRLLDKLIEDAGATSSGDATVLGDVDAWLAGFAGSGLTALANTLRRKVVELSRILADSDEARAKELARAGLLHVLSCPPSELSPNGVQARAFILGLVLHYARGAAGLAVGLPVRLIRVEERLQAEAMLDELKFEPPMEDAALCAHTRAFCEDPGVPTDSLMIRRLLLNAEFLVSVLEGDSAGEDDRMHARAALSYLALEEDAIDDRQGVVGYLDDAYILDTIVAVIDPARQCWMSLIEAAMMVAPQLVSAALLSEPFKADERLHAALVVPASGDTPVLLGVAAAANGLRAGTHNGLVVVAAPVEAAREVVESVRINGSKMGHLLTSTPPRLRLVPTLEAAAEVVSEQPDDVQFVLVDQAVAGGDEQPAALQLAVDAGTGAQLTREEEVEISLHLRRARAAGDQAAIDEAVRVLTERNLPLVKWVANKYKGRSESLFNDMVQEGTMGLMRAAAKFDHEKGARFGSYAVWWIREAVDGYLSNHSRTIRIPVSALRTSKKIKGAERMLTTSLGRAPTVAEIAEHCDVDEQTVIDSQRVARNVERGCIPIDRPTSPDGGMTLKDVLVNPSALLPLEEVAAREMGEEVRDLLSELPEREADVLRMYFGIGVERPHTLAEIGEHYGVRPERARQILHRGLGRLRFRAVRLAVHV